MPLSKPQRRSRRVSRFRRRYYGPQPRFKVGDDAGSFNVIEYLGHSRVAPAGTARTLSQEHHWYRVRCKCGNEEVHTQQQLIDTRRLRQCAECSQPGEKSPSEETTLAN